MNMPSAYQSHLVRQIDYLDDRRHASNIAPTTYRNETH